ncbi:MAG: hypothetical protein HZA15_11620 [Nitrospirae bacterium]|nr:hypothetical protein [Nitrospirota bacterium]
MIKEKRVPLIEKHIRPLVDRLNHLPNVKTEFSCHGHIGRPEAWVIFSSQDLELPYTLWKLIAAKIGSSSAQCGLRYFWTVKPWFTFFEERPAFVIVGTPIGRPSFLMRTSLPDEIEKLDKFLVFDHSDHCQSNKSKTNTNNSRMSIAPVSGRIFGLALGASVSIRSNRSFTSVTLSELGHELMYHAVSQKSTKNGNTILVCSPLKYGIAMWKAVDMLNRLLLEGAFKRSFKADGYFTDEREILLKITYGR